VLIKRCCKPFSPGFSLELSEQQVRLYCSRQYCRLAGIKSHRNFCGVAFSLMRCKQQPNFGARNFGSLSKIPHPVNTFTGKTLGKHPAL
jgi:hypothetical protein